MKGEMRFFSQNNQSTCLPFPSPKGPRSNSLQESPTTCHGSVLHQRLGEMTQSRTRPAKWVFWLLTPLSVRLWKHPASMLTFSRNQRKEKRDGKGEKANLWRPGILAKLFRDSRNIILQKNTTPYVIGDEWPAPL